MIVKKEEAKTKRLYGFTKPSLYKFLKREAKDNGTSINHILNKLIEEYQLKLSKRVKKGD
ncbi:MAG: hypothetical protein Nk1A_6800 [Endomicrobiia bacterium]|nr:MAG: hypothetical protein Nk1A_6800 [Endomicrobiia bacterium]